jgi:glycosyltransferase involved in cell wall biosynthesis
VVVSVTSDLVTDQRVHRVCSSLQGAGYEVTLIGRRKRDSLPLDSRTYHTRRMKLFFEKGPFFYAEFAFRLFFLLLAGGRPDILLANDLDTLLPNYLISRVRRCSLVYDNHEYYTGVPELEGRPFVRGIWKRIERHIFPKLSYVYTVNGSIAGLYTREYGVEVEVVRNAPPLAPQEETPPPPGFPEGRVILYQGAGINVDRGVEEAVEAMQYVNNATLLIIGGGDAIDSIRILAERLGLGQKVRFIPKMPFAKLREYTRHADIGLSLDKDTNINYRFSLPNKLFDYIHAGLPVLASGVTEVKAIVERYALGLTISSHDPRHIAERMSQMLDDEKQSAVWKANALRASRELCWQEEEKKLLALFNRIR